MVVTDKIKKIEKSLFEMETKTLVVLFDTKKEAVAAANYFRQLKYTCVIDVLLMAPYFTRLEVSK